MPYKLFLVPIFAAILAQIIKLLTDDVKHNFTWKHLVSDYGGMPSSHAAFVFALVTEMALVEGFKSSSFAIALIFALLVIRDALGLRWYISKENRLLNKISRQLNLNEKPLEEKIHHTLIEVIVGILLGVSLALIFYYLL